MMNYYFSVLKKYAVFSGRATRAEYWYFVLVNFAIGFVLGFIGALTGMTEQVNTIVLIYDLAILIPSIAVAVRRMHDTGKSGWFLFIPVYNFILTVTAGTDGDNKYGPNPKGAKVS